MRASAWSAQQGRSAAYALTFSLFKRYVIWRKYVRSQSGSFLRGSAWAEGRRS